MYHLIDGTKHVSSPNFHVVLDMLLTENRVMMKCSTLNLYLVIDVVIVIDYVYVILV
jgi:hypothetical protein